MKAFLLALILCGACVGAAVLLENSGLSFPRFPQFPMLGSDGFTALSFISLALLAVVLVVAHRDRNA